MINGHNLGRLIELAFDYVSAESEQQANQVYDRATMLTTETTTLKAWLELVDHIREWNSSNGHNYPMSWANALLFLSTRQEERAENGTTHKRNLVRALAR
jgi:hypothetical protein